MALRLIDTGRGRPAGDLALAPPSFDFDSQPLRPGIAYEAVDVELAPELTAEVADAAARELYPLEPWIVLVVESERAIRAVGNPRGFAEILNVRAANPPQARVHRSSRSRLLAYAAAIRQRAQAPPQRLFAGRSTSTLTLPVAYNSSVAWAHAAGEQRLPLSVWIAEHLAELPQGRPLWEAAAAETGRTLAEWVAIYAARSSPA